MDDDLGAQALESRRSGAATSGRDLETSNRLYEAATREWRALAESLHDLKKALEPEDFVAALTHLKIPDLGGLIHEWRRAQTSYEEVLGTTANASPDTERADGTSAASSSDPGRRASEADGERAPADEPRPAAAAPQAPGADAPAGTDEPTAIREQLAELTALLRQHVTLAGGQDQSSRIEIPRQLTLNIAREVAGRVKDSVLETLRESGVQGAEGGRRPESADREPDDRSRKVPLEDVAAMIDQLTKF